ncbi:hypothetical protein [Variovorax beijingensis]|jgi:hypothetical protein|uniref:hypothetical protein n=1 Tax=Variovorax beijingensis TaxID=2496117 RepID=UPI003F6A4DD7
MNNKIVYGCLAAGLGVAMLAQPVHASQRYDVQGGARCGPADGALVSGLKARKTGLTNESPAMRYITCEFPAHVVGGAAMYDFDYFSAGFTGPDATSITCALHVGNSDASYGTVSQTIVLPNGGDKYMRFYSGNGKTPALRNDTYAWASLTCGLPVGVELQGMWLGMQDRP